MKKFLIMVLVLAFVSAGLFSQEQEVPPMEGSTSHIGMELSFNWGVMVHEDFDFDPYFPNYGLNLDIVFNNFIMLSPEVYLVVHQFDFKPMWIAPGLILNFKFSSFFVGAGLCKWFVVSKTGSDSDWMLKINAGIDKNIRIMAYIETPFENAFDSIFFGATIGFRF
jgi:hypothetical protein